MNSKWEITAYTRCTGPANISFGGKEYYLPSVSNVNYRPLKK